MAVQTSIKSENLLSPQSPSYSGTPAATPQPQASTKYAKIQPAIAIKPKPAATPKSTFNPTYNQTAKPSSILNNESLINTSRKWVLPPRPRPGRKPTAGGSPGPEKTAPKKKCKVKREEVAAVAPVEKVDDGSPVLAKRRLGSASSATVTGVSGGSPQAISVSRKSSVTPIAVTPAPTTSSSVTASSSPQCQTAATSPGLSSNVQVNDLQKSYLARIKEQELIKNYIDVLTNQIKQLRFVQNGVITFDVLNDTSDSNVRAKKSLSTHSFELFDHINNIHDLDKYLAYLTTQLNVIHSVTKRVNGVGVGKPSNEQVGPVLRQVRSYLDRRAQNSEGTGSSTPEVSDGFTPSLLRPLRMNTLDSEDNLVVDIVSNSDGIGGERSRVDDAGPDLTVELMNLLHDGDTKSTQSKKSKKIGCGFCTNETPCVCFDADTF
ncbi:hypothetical protein C7M61_001643 [Candidozyma pseudohaemuli]|uniref:Hap4 transcription factor heteromerisation domain-containing protein n=1 Tax=Candidozyma pseudohaemuli TaxID=418784 RepID=A0A2P7YV47_9ASCO|nr:hypothetical protein C7M61_001643 [[Candida] pseudohaemulonii]PSK39834.1 hypothetical protein C7M61_001643 [[Candida] pseudohaemulonii]